MENQSEVTQLVVNCESGRFSELVGRDEEVLRGVFQSLTRKWGREEVRKRVPKVTYLKMVVANSSHQNDRILDRKIERSVTIL